MANKKKIATLGISSILLVAMVVALTIGTREDEENNSSGRQDISSSSKAIQTICGSTDYQETCVDTLKSSGKNTRDPKELIELAFEATIKYIENAAKNSTVLQKLQSDPRAKSALDNCHELANHAVNDLRRSYNKFKEFDVANFNAMLSDLKIWLSGAITYQETCLDGFEDVPGDAEEKMREALKKAMELTSNGLAMVTEISTVIESLGVQGFNNRRLLSEDIPIMGHRGEIPDWIDIERRELLSSKPKKIKPDLVVAKDGSGKYSTINQALKDIPKNGNKTFVLYIKEGVYEEKVQFNSSMTHLFMIGDGPTKTKITGHLNFIDGTNTYQTATVAVQADNFMAKDIGFENSAGAEKHQAVALRVSADKAIFYNCQMDGYQDTLYAHTYRQFYRDCVISGTIDFVFGDSAAVFQGCTLVVRKPMDNQQNIVTAQGRKDVRQPTGLVLQNCTFTADPAYYPVRKTLKSYLGRPWKEYSRTIIMESYLDDLIQPQGWLPWNETFALEMLFYAEFNNRGPAAPKAQRIKWPGVKELPSNRVERFTAAEFIGGDVWIPSTGVPYAPGFIFSVPKEDPNVKYSPVVPEENRDLGKTDQKESYIPSEKKDKDKDEDKKKEKDDDEDEDKKKDRDKDSDKKKDSGDEKEKSSDNSKSDSGYDFVIVEVPAPSTNSDSATVPSSIAASPYAAAPALSPTSPPKQDKNSMLKKFFGWI
jgi:pectinesterase